MSLRRQVIQQQNKQEEPYIEPWFAPMLESYEAWQRKREAFRQQIEAERAAQQLDDFVVGPAPEEHEEYFDDDDILDDDDVEDFDDEDLDW